MYNTRIVPILNLLSSDVISHFISELHKAASQGHDHTVLELLKQGVDINIKDDAGVSMTTLY